MNHTPSSSPQPRWYRPLERIIHFIDTKAPSDRFILSLLILTTLISGVMLGISYNNSVLVETPRDGGSLHEGMVGSPRFVNPALALTRADQDMVALLYSGLMSINAAGELVPDLAESVIVADDLRTYNINLRQDIHFHDGEPITADDVLFTISLIQNPALKSPLAGNFDGVTVEKLSEHEVNFVLKEPYAPFIENLTVGILPEHEWSDLTVDQIPFSQNNTDPIGSGPYQIHTIDRNQSGLIDGYTLQAFTEHHRTPRITTMEVTFFANIDDLVAALKEGTVTSATGITAERAAELAADPDLTLQQSPIPRTFSLFFNQNKSAALRQPEVRAALEHVIDRNELVDVALGGYGWPVETPIPYGLYTSTSTQYGTTSNERFTEAAEMLRDAGWESTENGGWMKKIDEIETTLTLDIATANLPFLVATSDYLTQQFTQLGVAVNVRQYEQTDLAQTVIRERDFEALLFGTAVNRGIDLYPFWHSSQRNDPGLNIALYANITTDAALTDARVSTSTQDRDAALAVILEEIATDQPAIFLYTPALVSVAPATLTAEPVNHISVPADRFATISDWYVSTEQLWPIFTQ